MGHRRCESEHCVPRRGATHPPQAAGQGRGDRARRHRRAGPQGPRRAQGRQASRRGSRAARCRSSAACPSAGSRTPGRVAVPGGERRAPGAVAGGRHGGPRAGSSSAGSSGRPGPVKILAGGRARGGPHGARWTRCERRRGEDRGGRAAGGTRSRRTRGTSEAQEARCMFEKLRNIFQVPELKRRDPVHAGAVRGLPAGRAHADARRERAGAARGVREPGGNRCSGSTTCSSDGRSRARRCSRSASCRTSPSSIILQLLGAVVPYFEKLRKEGEEGQKKITQITRYGTVLISVVQSFAYAVFL